LIIWNTNATFLVGDRRVHHLDDDDQIL